jgi:hypothetical protein
MIRLRVSDMGRVSGLPDEIPTGEVVKFELTSDYVEISEEDDLELKLALPEPVAVLSGRWEIGFGADSFEVEAPDVSAYSISAGLSSLDSVRDDGGVTVFENTGSRMIYVTFLDPGARDALTLSHSHLGPLAGRCRTVTAGGEGIAATFELDFSVETLAIADVAVNIDPAEVVVEEVDEGDVATAQRTSITISRHPDAGKFQIRTAFDSATRWLRPDASSYEVEMALEDVAPGEFIVSRRVKGQGIVLDLLRAEVGANTSVSASNTFIGPVGVEMDLDLSLARELLGIVGAKVRSAMLVFDRNGETLFAQYITLAPVLTEQPSAL